MSNSQLNPSGDSGSESSLESWIVLDDDLPSNLETKSNSSITQIDSIEFIDETEKSPELETPIINEQPKCKSDGFLTFDEFLQERILEHDYQLEEKPQKSKKKLKFLKSKKSLKRCKAPNWGISVFIAIMLTLTGFATLCSTLSQPRAQELNVNTKINKEPQEISLVKPQIHNNLSREQIQKEFKTVLEEFKTIQNFELKHNHTQPKIKQEINNSCPFPINIPISKRNSSSFYVFNKQQEDLKKFYHDDFKDLFTKIKSGVKSPSGWVILQELLLDTNIHAIVSLIVTNIYLFTLLLDITKRDNNKMTKADLNSIEELVISFDKQKFSEFNEKKNLLKELPFWGANIEEEIFNAENDYRRKTIKEPSTAIEISKAANVKGNNLFIFKATPTATTPFYPVTVPALVQRIESGKSECERRFDELDFHQKKFDTLKQNQRNRIKLLKQKFQNEIAYIKSTEDASVERAEHINQTSQKFIRKLKGNREKYILQIKKTKDLKKRAVTSKKDAETGIYDVAIPNTFNFYKTNKVQTKANDKTKCDFGNN